MGKDKPKKKEKKPSPELADETLEMEDGFTKKVNGQKPEQKKPAKKKPEKKEKPKKPAKKGIWSFLTRQVPTKKAYQIIGVGFMLALIIIAANLFLNRLKASLKSYYAFPESRLVPSPLTGVMTTEAQASRRVIGVVVENHPASRPQSGLREAGLVYEALVEGGITRFLAFYLENDSKLVGPIRSARIGYLSWVKELDALYAHIGGSRDGLAQIPIYGLKDLDQFSNADLYWRESSRYAPHNLCSTTKKLRQGGIDKGWENKNQFKAWQFQDAEEQEENPINRINIDFSGSLYAVEYRYDPEENSYQRYLADQPHKDLDNDWIKPKNILIQIVSQGLDSNNRLITDPIGGGQAYLFRDGRIFKGRWEKRTIEDRSRFYQSDNKELIFTRGKIWVHILPSADQLSYH